MSERPKARNSVPASPKASPPATTRARADGRAEAVKRLIDEGRRCIGAGNVAGAMGKRCVVLLPYQADWRWLADRADSPWYASMGLFRQPRRDDWETPLREVSEAVRVECERLCRLRSGEFRHPDARGTMAPEGHAGQSTLSAL
jgi:hypothetical protein